MLKNLGQGAMGDVHLARPFNPKRGVPAPIVIKRLHGELASNEDFVRRFKHEAAVAVNIDSHHVAKVYDVGKVGETLYIAMEFVAGWPLSKFLDAVIDSGRHASIASIVDLVAGGLKGLEALHSAVDKHTRKALGIVHRDISPKNLMVGEDGSMRLIDLGLGKSNVQDWKTRTGVIMGSVGYMPPEQVQAGNVDHRADLYAMGVVLFEMLALRNFIARGAIPMMLRASLNPTFSAPSVYRPDVPPGLDEVVRRAVQPIPADRYQSAGEFLTELRRVVPLRHTEGGMVSLIGDLFGAKLEERAVEISQLLQLPLPELEEGPDNARTVVFVEREGVAPLTEEDFQPTRVTEPGVDPAPPPVASWSGMGSGAAAAAAPGAAFVAHDSFAAVAMSNLPSTNGHTAGRVSTYGAVYPAGVSQTSYDHSSPFVSGSMVPPQRTGVPLGVVVGLLGAAVALTAVVMFLVLKQPSDEVSLRQAGEAAHGAPTAIGATGGVAAVIAPPPTPPPTPPAPTPPSQGAASGLAQAPVHPGPAPEDMRRRAVPPPTRKTGLQPLDGAGAGAVSGAAAPAAPASEGPLTNEELNRRLTALITQVQSLKKEAADGSLRANALDELRMKASQTRASTDLERKTRQTKEVEDELRRLSDH
jgi:serine/threonine-protein kinase